MAARARELGFSLLPWQKQVLSIGLERAGRVPAYRDVAVSVPRQSGKSSLALSLIVWRLLSEPDQLVLYSAQNRVAARRKLLHTWWPRIRRSPLAEHFTLFRGFGNESLSADNGSRLELSAPPSPPAMVRQPISWSLTKPGCIRMRPWSSPSGQP